MAKVARSELSGVASVIGRDDKRLADFYNEVSGECAPIYCYGASSRRKTMSDTAPEGSEAGKSSAELNKLLAKLDAGETVVLDPQGEMTQRLLAELHKRDNDRPEKSGPSA